MGRREKFVSVMVGFGYGRIQLEGNLGNIGSYMESGTFAIVTGAGSGIGRATAIELSKESLTILAVGRRRSALEETAEKAPGEIRCLSADVSSDVGCRAIIDAIGINSRVKFLVHAAGISPINRVQDTGIECWRRVMRTNLDAQFILTTSLIQNLAGGGRVLFVGSNSAKKPRKGAAAYCVSKAASYMLQECLKLELDDEHILVTSAIPSPVNTDMVRSHISTDSNIFPDGNEYAQLLAEGKLIEPSIVGEFFQWLLTRTREERYVTEDWNIQDQSHHPEWLRGKALWPGLLAPGLPL